MTFEEWLELVVEYLTDASRVTIDRDEALEWFANGEEARTFAYVIEPQEGG